jgi:hypothetical protein
VGSSPLRIRFPIWLAIASLSVPLLRGMVIIRMMLSTTRIKPYVRPAVKPQSDLRDGADLARMEER